MSLQAVAIQISSMGREMSFSAATAAQPQNHRGPAGPDRLQKKNKHSDSTREGKSIFTQMLQCAFERRVCVCECVDFPARAKKSSGRLLLGDDAFAWHARASTSVCMASPARSDQLKAARL